MKLSHSDFMQPLTSLTFRPPLPLYLVVSQGVYVEIAKSEVINVLQRNSFRLQERKSEDIRCVEKNQKALNKQRRGPNYLYLIKNVSLLVVKKQADLDSSYWNTLTGLNSS